MRGRSIPGLTLCLTVLSAMSAAQDVQHRAQALLDKARQLSDIRAPNAPSFRLQATFSLPGKDLALVQGSYTEVWVSKSKWRRETVIKDWRRLEIGGAARFWRLDNSSDVPDQSALLPNAMEMFLWPPLSLTFESVSDHPAMDPPAECVLTRPDGPKQNLRLAFCFDKKSGVLLEKVFPAERPWNMVSDACDYRSFRQIGERWLPQEIVCFEDKHRELDIKLTDLSFETPDPTLFNPPAGAIELGICSVKPNPPRPAVHPAPRWPPASDQKSQVALSVVVDIKGNPQDVRVVSSAGAHFDEAAVSTVRSWRFFPATCEGEPMPMQIEVQVHFPRQLH
jgi:TonB family protein